MARARGGMVLSVRVFSAASPVLDDSLGKAGADGGPGCAASGVRDRYDMGDAPTDGEVLVKPRGGWPSPGRAHR